MNKELANEIEALWQNYNQAIVTRFHRQQAKDRLANIMIVNINDILEALRADVPMHNDDVHDDTSPAEDASHVITADAGANVKVGKRKHGVS